MAHPVDRPALLTTIRAPIIDFESLSPGRLTSTPERIMATFKIACPECGQKVSGDESFLGTIVDCPLCNTKIKFPKEAPPVPETRPSEAEPSTSEGKAGGESPRDVPAAPEPREASPATPVPAATPAKAPAAPAILITSSDAPARPKAVRTSGAALWSAIFGVAAIIFCPIGILFAVPAIVAGHSARSSILSSMGKIGGQGLATAGLALGYTYATIFFLAVVFGTSYIKPLSSFFEQRANTESAKVIIAAATSFASDHGGNFPAQLSELVPDYLPEGVLETPRYIEPGSLPPEYLDFTYYPGHNTESGSRIILLSAPDADRSYQRLVGYLDGRVDVIAEEDFIVQAMKQGVKE